MSHSSDKHDRATEIFKALRSLVNRSFPIECSCGEIFYTLDEFLEQTVHPEQEHGLFERTEYNDENIANLLRECPNCGSTLMAVFSERRDQSPSGQRGRKLFAHLLETLTGAGHAQPTSRQELLNVVAGKESELVRTTIMKDETLLLDALLSQSREI